MICYGERTERIFATARWRQNPLFGTVITVRLAAFHAFPDAIALFWTSTVRKRVQAATSFLQMIRT